MPWLGPGRSCVMVVTVYLLIQFIYTMIAVCLYLSIECYSLVLKIISALKQQSFFTPSASIRSQLKEANLKLLDYYDFKLRGTIIRSRARWVEEGEKNSKYFLNLEKHDCIVKTKEVSEIELVQKCRYRWLINNAQVDEI